MAQPDDRPRAGPPVARRFVLSAGLLAAGAAGGLATRGVLPAQSAGSRSADAGSRGAGPGVVATPAPTGPPPALRPAPVGVAAFDPARVGLAPVEAFRTAGADDDTAFAAALAHSAAQTFHPPIVFADREYRLTRRARPFSGVHLLAFGSGDEFTTSQSVRIPAGGVFSFEREVRGVTLENLSAVLTDHLLEPIAGDDSQGSWRDLRVLGGGYRGGTTLLSGSFLRLDFQPRYVNGVSDAVVSGGGSDSWMFTTGQHYVSGMLPADRPFLDLAHFSQTTVGHPYITAQGGYAVRISGGHNGLVLDGLICDATGRSGPAATQQAGLQITGGSDITIRDLDVFNANVAGTSAALVTVTGGEDIVFSSPRFRADKGDWVQGNAATPCIHTTVPITVIAPKGNRDRTITASDPALVTLVGAPGWTVRQA